MASFQQFQISSAPFASPAKIFAKLKSKVQREKSEDVSDGDCRAAESHGGLLTPRRNTADDVMQHEMFFGQSEVTALTLSPISSPQKTPRRHPEDERQRSEGTEPDPKLAYTLRHKPFMESTAMDSYDQRDLEAAPGPLFSPAMARLRKRKLDDQSKANIFSAVNYLHSQDKGMESGRAFPENIYYSSKGGVDPVAQRHTDKLDQKACIVDTPPCHPGTPAKIFAHLKVKENQRDQCDFQKVTSNTRPADDWDNESEAMEEAVYPVSRAPRLLSPDLDKPDPPPPVVPDAPLSPLLCVSIPKLQQSVVKPRNWSPCTSFPIENEIYLKKWFIRKHHNGLFIDGIRRDNGVSWNSNIIEKRVSKSVLKTVTGRTYVLVGKMDFGAPSKFPKWFLKKFANGFPSNWKEIYENFISQSKGTLIKTPQTQAENSSRKTRTLMEQSVQQRSMKINSDTSFSKPNIQVSRSGRLIKPPLEYWRGGRVMLDAEMNVTIHDGYNSVLQPDVPSTPNTSKPVKSTALVTASLNNDCEKQEFIPPRPLQRKVTAPQRKRHIVKGNVTEKPPSPVNQSPTYMTTRFKMQRLMAEKTSHKAEPKDSKNTTKKSNKEQRVSNDNAVTVNQRRASKRRSPPADSHASSQPRTHRQEKAKPRAKHAVNKSPEEIPRKSSSSSHSSQERETHSHSLQKKRSKPSPKPQWKPPAPKPVEAPTESGAQPNRTRQRTARSKPSSVQDGDKWTEEELRKLQEAVLCHPQHVTGYWTKVAMMVGTRSAEECHKRHTCKQGSSTPAKRESKAKQKMPLKEKVDNPIISARVGTLRRKQQVRDFLENMPKDDMNDIFSSKYAWSKRIEIPSICLSDKYDFSLSDQEPLTPGPSKFPEAKTPQCLHISPGMMGSSSRNYDDKYVFHLQKLMKNQNQFNVQKNARKNFSPVASVKKNMRRCGNTENDTFVVWEMFPENDAQVDSEEEEDFYFSEND